MRKVHPDANSTDPQATRKAARINQAFETLGNPQKRRAYDREHRGNGAGRRADSRAGARRYAEWAEQPDWEDIVAEHVPSKRPAHIHAQEPLVEPDEIEVAVDELERSPRVRSRIKVTNLCDCTLKGDVSTSEPWLWGPIGPLRIGPGESAEFDVEVVSRKVTFPGLSRVSIVTNTWTGTVPVRITGYVGRPKRRPQPTDSRYVRSRRRRAVRR
jgi:hypothetical protein